MGCGLRHATAWLQQLTRNSAATAFSGATRLPVTLYRIYTSASHGLIAATSRYRCIQYPYPPMGRTYLAVLDTLSCCREPAGLTRCTDVSYRPVHACMLGKCENVTSRIRMLCTTKAVNFETSESKATASVTRFSRQ